MYLLTYYADQFRTTVFRQTMFAEFEKLIHERAESGEALTPQALSEIYYDLNVKYHGKGMVVDKDIEMEWAHSAFLQQLLCIQIRDRILGGDKLLQANFGGRPARGECYLGFLKSGGSDFSINILKKPASTCLRRSRSAKR